MFCKFFSNCLTVLTGDSYADEDGDISICAGSKQRKNDNLTEELMFLPNTLPIQSLAQSYTMASKTERNDLDKQTQSNNCTFNSKKQSYRKNEYQTVDVITSEADTCSKYDHPTHLSHSTSHDQSVMSGDQTCAINVKRECDTTYQNSKQDALTGTTSDISSQYSSTDLWPQDVLSNIIINKLDVSRQLKSFVCNNSATAQDVDKQPRDTKS